MGVVIIKWTYMQYLQTMRMGGEQLTQHIMMMQHDNICLVFSEYGTREPKKMLKMNF